MNLFFWGIVSVGILVALGCGVVGGRVVESSNKQEADATSVFAGWIFKSAHGSTIDLGDVMKSDVTVVSFFTTYCTKCKQKLVDHQALYAKYGEDKLSIVGVAVDEPETQSSVGPYVRSRGLTFPVVLDTESRLVEQLNPRRTLPFSVLINRQGEILWTHVGYAPSDGELFEAKILEQFGQRK